jgi:hypothetical protein
MSTYKQKVQRDYKFGIFQENEKQKIIDKYLNLNTIKLSDNHCYDFYDANNKTFIEIKSRNVQYNTYPDTVVGKNKIDYISSQSNDHTFYFIFNFTDGMYYIKYEKELFETFTVKLFGRYDRGRKEFNNYLFIPINHLNKINP